MEITGTVETTLNVTVEDIIEFLRLNCGVSQYKLINDVVHQYECVNYHKNDYDWVPLSDQAEKVNGKYFRKILSAIDVVEKYLK